ncbi:Tolloid-like protein 1 [Actinomadura sp. WAC 06369]|uniref:Tolloid-like protein 1 n=1 Tax=Actinomadura sp. WAC 06369 TaxID=2203193 RepID=UPI000F77B19A|nr:Tolloid-like protein 1 [Actinomadura sp. WAC 06369]
MSNPHGLCVDVYPPGESYVPPEADDVQDRTVASRNELAVARMRKWQAGQELRIGFLDGGPGVRRRIQQHAEKWLEFANVKFSFGNFARAEIRISCQGNGYWSYVGTDALRVPPGEPTMVLDGFDDATDESELRRVVLHEFGHALGCVHEQASPAVQIPWDVDKVYEHYRRWQGWDRSTTFANVLRRYSGGDVEHSSYDPDSIMQYPVPAELTLGGFSIGWNRDLSAGDRAFIAEMYPGRAPQGTPPVA